jgi:hypothetical protein
VKILLSETASRRKAAIAEVSTQPETAVLLISYIITNHFQVATIQVKNGEKM